MNTSNITPIAFLNKAHKAIWLTLAVAVAVVAIIKNPVHLISAGVFVFIAYCFKWGKKED